MKTAKINFNLAPGGVDVELHDPQDNSEDLKLELRGSLVTAIIAKLLPNAQGT